MPKQVPPDNKPSPTAGYGRPPEHSRFKKGRSGNRKGRPKRTQNLKSELLQVYTSPVLIDDAGKERRVPRVVAIALLQLQRALNNDVRAAEAVLKRVKELFFLNQTSEASIPSSEGVGIKNPTGASKQPIQCDNDKLTSEEIATLTNEQHDLLIRAEKLIEKIWARKSNINDTTDSRAAS